MEELHFLARAREVGFDLQECRQLLDLQRDRSRQSRHARELVLEKSQQLQKRIEQLQAHAAGITGSGQPLQGG